MLIDIHQSDAMGNIFTLREDLTVEGITVPAGFASDGASVPRFFWRLVFPPGDQKALRAAFVHDWLYRTHPEGWTREQADMLFLKLLLAEGMPKFRAVLAWLGVRLFGKAAWNAGGAPVISCCRRYNSKDIICRVCPDRPKKTEIHL